MIDWTNHIMSPRRYEEIRHMRAMIEWLENFNGGALHIVIEDGNYEDEDVQWCRDYISSGEYKKNLAEWGYYYPDDMRIDEQLQLAQELLELTEQEREMICENSFITERLFDYLFNGEDDGRE